jgi:hypothetical protein
VPRAYLASQYCNLHCNIATFLATYLRAIVAVEPCNARSVSGVMRNSDEIERAVTALADSANGGLIVTSSVHHDLIIGLAARHKLPAVYGNRSNVNGGGVAFYGPERIDQFRRGPATSIAFSGARNRQGGTNPKVVNSCINRL